MRRKSLTDFHSPRFESFSSMMSPVSSLWTASATPSLSPPVVPPATPTIKPPPAPLTLLAEAEAATGCCKCFFFFSFLLFLRLSSTWASFCRRRLTWRRFLSHIATIVCLLCTPKQFLIQRHRWSYERNAHPWKRLCSVHIFSWWRRERRPRRTASAWEDTSASKVARLRRILLVVQSKIVHRVSHLVIHVGLLGLI